MRIAVPIWNDKISPVFDTASRLLIINTKNLSEVERFETYLGEKDISKRCLLIHDLKVNVLICGAISRSFSMLLMSAGINVISGISGLADDVLKAYLHGYLANSKYLMPGCKTNHLTQMKEENEII
jgi:predicted Fe-Mo cluster-binding NifX family protein